MKIIRKGRIVICKHALDSENRANICKRSMLFYFISFHSIVLYCSVSPISTFIFELLCNLERYHTREEKPSGFAGLCI